MGWLRLGLLAFLGVQFVVLWWPLARQELEGPSLRYGMSCFVALLPYVLGSNLVRAAGAALARRWRPGNARPDVRVGLLIFDQAWMLAAFAAVTVTYTWCKVLLPAYGGQLWDARLAVADRWVSAGLNPNVFLLTIFRLGPKWAAHALDLYYLSFVWTMLAGTAWFLTDPRRERRFSFAVGAVLLWSVGLWGYIAMPALGPALAYEGLWRQVAAVFPIAAGTEKALFENYQQVLAVLTHPGAAFLVTPELGAAAMPSLHVAAHAFLFFWANRIGSRLRAPLLAMTILTFTGSVATGWHYAIDSWVGLLLGWLCARGAWYLARRLTVAPAMQEEVSEGPVSERLPGGAD